MTIRIFFLSFFIGVAMVVHAQKAEQPNFDMKDFSSKMEVADWLYKYDMVAWRTSDSVMVQNKKDRERLGKEWFCFYKNNLWHAVYGKYQDKIFDLVFHFQVDSNGKVSKNNEMIDTTLLHRYSRALQTANTQLKALRDTVKISFNQYIRENDDMTLSVWIFPAFQSNSFALYGLEFIYTINESGNEIVKDESYVQKLRGFKVDKPREIWIDYSQIEKPTLGSIFFVWYYKSYFTKIYIDNSTSISTAIKDRKEWTWIHVEKDREVRKKKKRG